MLLLQKHLLPILRATPPLPTSSLLRLLSTAPSSSASPNHFAVEDYLITSCHLSPAQALKASKYLSHLKSPSNPNAVLAFLAGLDLSPADIATAVSLDPRLLLARVEKTLTPRVAELRDLGLGPPQIARLVPLAPSVFRCPSLVSKLLFWIPFLGSYDNVLEAVRKNSYLLGSHIEKVVKPNISLLQQCGLSVCDIIKLFSRTAWLVTTNPVHLEAVVARAEELGVPRGTAMFRHALGVVFSLRPEKVAAKLEFLKSLGWSDAQVAMAVTKLPVLLTSSVERLLRAIEFLTEEVGLDVDFIVRMPALLKYSLERRLVPRHFVIKVLKAKGLPDGYRSFNVVASSNEKKFLQTFINPHKESIPGLAEAYAAACAGKVPIKFAL